MDFTTIGTFTSALAGRLFVILL